MHEALSGAAAFNRTDAGNGEYFARLYGDRLRYDHRRGHWLLWNGHWWRDDETRAVRRLAKEAARARYGRATAIADLRDREAEARFAIGSENRQRLDAMLAAAQTEPPIVDPGNAWDADPWLLGVGTASSTSGQGRFARVRPTIGSPATPPVVHLCERLRRATAPREPVSRSIHSRSKAEILQGPRLTGENSPGGTAS